MELVSYTAVVDINRPAYLKGNRPFDFFVVGAGGLGELKDLVMLLLLPVVFPTEMLSSTGWDGVAGTVWEGFGSTGTKVGLIGTE